MVVRDRMRNGEGGIIEIGLTSMEEEGKEAILAGIISVGHVRSS